MKLNTDCSESIFISGGNVFDGNNFSEKDILIENGYIVKIGKNLKCNADIIYNAKGDFVSCGLTDFHTHIKGISPDSIGIEADKISVPFGVSQLVDASAELGGISNTVSPFAQISVFARVHIFGNRADFSMTEKCSVYTAKRLLALRFIMTQHSRRCRI